MDEAAESITTLDRAVLETWRPVGRLERAAAVGPIVVVVVEVLDKHPTQVTLVADQCPVKTLAAHRADDAFGVGVRNRRPDSRQDHVRRAYGFHSAAAMIALAMLVCGGLRPLLPGRA